MTASLRQQTPYPVDTGDNGLLDRVRGAATAAVRDLADAFTAVRCAFNRSKGLSALSAPVSAARIQLENCGPRQGGLVEERNILRDQVGVDLAVAASSLLTTLGTMFGRTGSTVTDAGRQLWDKCWQEWLPMAGETGWRVGYSNLFNVEGALWATNCETAVRFRTATNTDEVHIYVYSHGPKGIGDNPTERAFFCLPTGAAAQLPGIVRLEGLSFLASDQQDAVQVESADRLAQLVTNVLGGAQRTLNGEFQKLLRTKTAEASSNP